MRIVAGVTIWAIAMTFLNFGGLNLVSWQNMGDTVQRRLQLHMTPTGVDATPVGDFVEQTQTGPPSVAQPYNPFGSASPAPAGAEDGAGEDWQKKAGEGGSGSSAFLSAIIFWVYACMYKNWVVDELPEFGGISTAEYPKLCDCFKISEWGAFFRTCCWTSCCMPIVAAKNYAGTDTCGFWSSICCLWCGYSAGWVPGACVKAKLSMDLKENLNLDTNCCQEFLLALFCPWCETARESMQVDEELGVDIQCCFRVEKTGGIRTFFKDVGEVLGLEDKRVDVLQEEERPDRDRMCKGDVCVVM